MMNFFEAVRLTNDFAFVMNHSTTSSSLMSRQVCYNNIGLQLTRCRRMQQNSQCADTLKGTHGTIRRLQLESSE
jgi:hypothetical protein